MLIKIYKNWQNNQLFSSQWPKNLAKKGNKEFSVSFSVYLVNSLWPIQWNGQYILDFFEFELFLVFTYETKFCQIEKCLWIEA